MKTRLSIAAAALALVLLHSGCQDKGGSTSMFNGIDLTGWEGAPGIWSVENGAIVGSTARNPARGNTFLVWTNGQPGDFEMRCSYKLTSNNKAGFANSGIQYRSKVIDPSYWLVAGYQADIDAGPDYTGQLYEEKGRTFLAKPGEKVVWHADGKKEVVGSLGELAQLQNEIHKGDWNDYVIIAQGNHLQQFINGKQMIDVVDEQTDKAARSGVIALQIHAGPPMTVEFKNLSLKELK